MKIIPLCILLLFICATGKTIAQVQPAYPEFRDELPLKLKEDSSSKLLIREITIKGNKKTRSYIILREILLKKGDSVIAGKLMELVTLSKNLVYNSNLFLEVDIQPILESAYELRLEVTVKERWYILPIPQFKLTDRNFNEWFKVYNADFNRVIYGAKFTHYNFSGRGDQLRVSLLSGYARSLSFSYVAPASNNALTEGYAIATSYTQNREIPIQTSQNNKLIEFKRDDFVRDNFAISLSYRIRRGYFITHFFAAQYSYTKVNDSIVTSKYNPSYFNTSKSYAHIPEISYAFLYSNTNNVNYPQKGKIYGFALNKRGLGFTGGTNMLSIDGSYRLFIPHQHQFFSSIAASAKLKLPFRQAYINQRALGYNEFYLRGLEYYVIDGYAAALVRYTLAKKLFSFRIPLPFHIRQIPYLPFSFYGKAFGDAGFANNTKEYNTLLNNRALYTYGVGIDILALYDTAIRLEYSFNQLGEKGLFLHVKGGF